MKPSNHKKSEIWYSPTPSPPTIQFGWKVAKTRRVEIQKICHTAVILALSLRQKLARNLPPFKRLLHVWSTWINIETGWCCVCFCLGFCSHKELHPSRIALDVSLNKWQAQYYWRCICIKLTRLSLHWKRWAQLAFYLKPILVGRIFHRKGGSMLCRGYLLTPLILTY